MKAALFQWYPQDLPVWSLPPLDNALGAMTFDGAHLWVAAGEVEGNVTKVRAFDGATLVGDGPLTGPAVELLSAQGPTVAIAAANLTAEDSVDGMGATADVTPVRYSPAVVAAPFDPTVSAALAGAGSNPWSPSYLDAGLDVSLQHDSAPARRQDALGALLWRTLTPTAEPRTQILMPPMDWGLGADDAAESVFVSADEYATWGRPVAPDGYTATFALGVDEFCGNGFTEPPEECDDHNAVDEDGCSAACLLEFCGDNTIQAGLGERHQAGSPWRQVHEHAESFVTLHFSDHDRARFECGLRRCGTCGA